MTNTIQLQPHTTSTIPLHIESPATLSARTAIEILTTQSPISDAIIATLTRNDETGQILIPTISLTELANKKFLILETLEPHSFRDYLLTLEPTASLNPELQKQSTSLEIKYGIESIAQPTLPTPSPSSPTLSLRKSSTTQMQLASTSAQEQEEAQDLPIIRDPQVLGVTTTNTSSPSAIPFGTLPKLPPLFFLLLFIGTACGVYFFIRKLSVATRVIKENAHSRL